MMNSNTARPPSVCSCGHCTPENPCNCAACMSDRLRGPYDPLTKAEKWLRETRPAPTWDGKRYIGHEDQRHTYNKKFGYAIINQPIIDLLKELQPLLEVGAGIGYWASELLAQHVDVIPTNYGEHWLWKETTPWTTVEELEAEAAVLKYPQRNLLMCWPDFIHMWPIGAIRAFKGKHMAIVGENQSESCTSYPDISRELAKRYRLTQKVQIPQFRSINDDLEVWTRIQD